MRLLLVLLLTASIASADVGVSIVSHASNYANQPNQTIGIGTELSIDRRHFQLLGEAAVEAVSYGEDFFSGIEGPMLRAGVGIRYFAKRFDVAKFVSDLGFEGIVALQDLELGGGDRDIRPELDLGFAWTFGMENKAAFRVSLRVTIAPSPSHAMACNGPCPTDDAVTTGSMLVMGMTW